MSPFNASLTFVSLVVKRDWRSFVVTLACCSVAALVTCFQYSVYTSFVRASAVAPRFIGGDVWVTAATVECFDFPTPINEDYAATVARFLPGATFRRAVFGFATWRSPSGRRGNVAIIGVDGAQVDDLGFIVDQADLARLDLGTVAPGGQALATISNTTLRFAGTTDQLPTFLGAPYVVVSLDRGRALLGMDPSTTSFLIGDLPGADRGHIDAATRAAATSFPDIALRSAADFRDSSAAYWQGKTGAGMAILLAAVLAGLLMTILLANGVLRFIQRYHHDLISLLGHGAGKRDIALIVAGIALVIAVVTLMTAIAGTPVIIRAVAPILPWTSFQWSDAIVPTCAITGALLVAMAAASSAIAGYGPEAVFRT